jgi:hypothetical protein
VGAIPMALAAIVFLLFGIETRNRQLEQIVAEEFKRVRTQHVAR